MNACMILQVPVDTRSDADIVIASHHDLASAPQIFDQALLLRKQLIACGPAQEVLTPENLKRTFNPA